MLQTIDHGPVRELRLDRPPANALSPELIAALGEAVLAAPGEGARALVISGAPGRYSGGLDVPLLLTLDRAAIRSTWRDFYTLLGALAASPVPVAAAMTGHAPAGGTVLAIFCDYRVMAEGDFKVGLNEVPVGIPMPPVIHGALAHWVGPGKAERLCVTGRLISPAEAEAVGLVDELAPLDEVIPRAVDWLRGLLALPSGVVARTRTLCRADLVRLFDRREGEVDWMVDRWFEDETQATLRGLVERLAAKKRG